MRLFSRLLIPAALAVSALTGAAGAASAHMAPGHMGSAHFGHPGSHFHGRHGHLFVGLGGWDDGYGYGYGAGDDCGYLRFKAHQTGRPYWWGRYHQCIAG